MCAIIANYFLLRGGIRLVLYDFGIKNFRAFKSLELKNFKKVNIFVGEPNTGKTSILEALSLFLAKNPQMLISLLDERNMLGDSACFEGLFFDYNIDDAIILHSNSIFLKISPDFENKSLVVSNQTNSIDISNYTDFLNNLKFIFTQQDKEIFSNEIRFDKVELNKIRYNVTNVTQDLMLVLKSVEFISNLKNREYFDKFIHNLSIIIADTAKNKELQQKIKIFAQNIDELKFTGGNKILVQQKHLQHAVDLRLLGQGFQTYIFILIAILSGKKYILIDEIENGLHFENIDLLLKSILESPKDAQFFITTHDEEILKRLAKKLEEKYKKDELIAFFRIYYDKKNELKATYYSQENFIHAINHKNEVRG